ncbi:hypothetical protein F5887DRAFT_1076979 [Amanita rubescens]|nr:hypothetical protein F5887DRAFT_1076979 [Amanita rubescens]
MRFASLILALGAATAASAYYLSTFSNLDAATVAPDYLTYTLVPNPEACFTACDDVSDFKCGFVNTYYDVNGKNGSTELTCSMYRSCHYADTATNKGGQRQPSGLLDYITDSDGWCREGS